MHESDTLNIMRFDSVAEAGRFVAEKNLFYVADLEWLGGIDGPEAARRAVSGDEAAVPEAERLIERFSTSIESTAPFDAPSVAGCYPIVPEALAGEPECMREPQEMGSDTAPLDIMVDIGCSTNFDADEMRRRGVAILALVMALSACRPIGLTLVSTDWGNPRLGCNDCFSITTARVETAPLDLATAAFAITHIGFSRSIMLSVGVNHFRSGGMWPEFHGVSRGGRGAESPEFRAKVLHYLGADDDTLYIAPGSVADENKLLTENPEAWVKQLLEKYGHHVEQ